MEAFNSTLSVINSILWHNSVLFVVLCTGVVFTFWSGFCQFRAITHGTKVLRGHYHDPSDPGAISHFQALSAALSATVGLGNIGGVALAIALGGPGAVFWMWVVGFFGMSVKLTEVTLSMLYRNTDDPDNPHGGPMWVASKGLAKLWPERPGLGRGVGALFCITVLISTVTGGNMFQAWNVAALTEQYFGVPGIATGVILSILVGGVIIGGIKRIGTVAGFLVPFMVSLYLIAGFYVLFKNSSVIPEMFGLILTSAFTPAEAGGAFLGGSAGYAFLYGMKRALFSSEVGQGSSPIAHSAAKTDEPVREGIVAGLEPFIDTLVVCTFTALVILSSGVWNRSPDAHYLQQPNIVPVAANVWSVELIGVPERNDNEQWREGDAAYMVLNGVANEATKNNLHRLSGRVVADDSGLVINWDDFESPERPRIHDRGVFATYVGALLTAKAFDSARDGLGKWLVTIAAWLFAISTIISWSYYGEQGMVFLAGEKYVLPYKIVYCLLIVVATLGFIKTDTELDNLTTIGAGVMLLVNVPIMWIFGHQAMAAYRNYIGRLKSGDLGKGHPPPDLDDLLSGRDLE